MKAGTLARNIERDLLAERPRSAPTPECFACGRGYTPGQPGGDDSARFCSDRCRIAYDAGLPRHVSLPTASDWIGADTGRMVQVAGPLILRCDRCGGLCVELYRKRGKAYCNWRCRDDKPRGCRACGKSLYNTGRKGPYCSTTCANGRVRFESDDATGKKAAKRPPGAKPQNSASRRPVDWALLRPVSEADTPPQWALVQRSLRDPRNAGLREEWFGRWVKAGEPDSGSPDLDATQGWSDWPADGGTS